VDIAKHTGETFWTYTRSSNLLTSDMQWNQDKIETFLPHLLRRFKCYNQVSRKLRTPLFGNHYSLECTLPDQDISLQRC
ncbi:unnamed protein product, partial [Brassica rapa]